MNRCPNCTSAVDIRSPYVGVHDGGVQIFCSAECMRGERVAPEPTPGVPPEAPRRVWLRSAGAGIALVTMLVGAGGSVHEPPPPAPPPRHVFLSLPPVMQGPPAPEPPEPPAPEPEWVADILRDVWMHPLAGPIRRMPRLDGAVFGAERPGERPPECKNGHCGVDIGGDVWGEQVLAAHDGVVDRVQRGPNEEHGGLYVRIAHRNGTVFTQYFHLAAIPRWIFPGKKVAAGDVIGLLGDSGVKNSGPHLHFTISVKPSPQMHEVFMDPEPLIALWPLRLAGAKEPTLTVATAPGAVRGAASKRRHVSGRTQPSALAAAADGSGDGDVQ